MAESPAASCSLCGNCKSGLSATSSWNWTPHPFPKTTRSLCRRRELASPAPSGPASIRCSSVRRSMTVALRRIATSARWTLSLPRRLRQSPSWFKSPAHTASRKRTVRRYRATSKSRFARRSRPARSSATGPSTKPANSPPRPSSPKVPTKEKSRACARTPTARASSQEARSQQGRDNQGRRREAPPRGSAGPDNGVARIERDWRGCACPADEARPAFRRRAAGRNAGRASSGHRSPSAWHRQSEEPRRYTGQATDGFCPQGRGERSRTPLG